MSQKNVKAIERVYATLNTRDIATEGISHWNRKASERTSLSAESASDSVALLSVVRRVAIQDRSAPTTRTPLSQPAHRP
jgi:hypothetical protein